ncbi:hypothetical protein [Streptomyces sp. NPDC005004]
MAQEKRMEREQEVLAEMVASVAAGQREVQIRHAETGNWSLTGTATPHSARGTGRPSRGAGRRPGARGAARRRHRAAPVPHAQEFQVRAAGHSADCEG